MRRLEKKPIIVAFVGAICFGCAQSRAPRSSPVPQSPELAALARLGAGPLDDEGHNIYLGRNVDDEHFAKLQPHLLRYGKVRVLNLSGYSITDASIPLISELTQLRELLVHGTRVTAQGVKGLRGLRELRLLVVDNEFTYEELLDVRAALPKAEVWARPLLPVWPASRQGHVRSTTSPVRSR